MPHSGLSLTYNSYKDNKVLTAASVMYVQKKAYDNIFGPLVGFQWLFGKPLNDQYRVPDLRASGALILRNYGQSIDIPMMTAKNATAKSYSRYGTFDTTPQEGLGPAFIDWRQYGVTATLDGFSERAAGGDIDSIVDLVQFTNDQALWSLKDAIGADLWATSKEFTTDIEGFAYYITADAATGTVSNVNRANESWHRNKYNGGTAYTGQLITNAAPSFAAIGKTSMMQMILECSAGPGLESPDGIFTTQTIWSYLWDSLEDQKRYTNIVTADAGFKTLEFMGVPVLWDTGVASGRMYFFNRKTWALVAHREANFKMGAYVEPDNQDAKTAKIIWQGNIINKGPRRNGNLTGIVA